MKGLPWICALLPVLILCVHGAAAIGIDSYTVNIEKKDKGYDVHESIIVENNTEMSMLLWIQDGAKNIEIKLNGKNMSYNRTDCIYLLNIDNVSSFQLSVNYTLPYNVSVFQKNLMYRCGVFSVKLDGKIIYEGINLTGDSSIRFDLKGKSAGEKNYLYIYTSIIFAFIAVASIIYAVKARKGAEEGFYDSKILKEERGLLMGVLKELEKKYKNKEIEDGVYTELKEKYKKKVVDIVRKLEEQES